MLFSFIAHVCFSINFRGTIGTKAISLSFVVFLPIARYQYFEIDGSFSEMDNFERQFCEQL